ncbi:MAG: FAD:protein FMN transferase [Ignavibacteriales bacterium]
MKVYVSYIVISIITIILSLAFLFYNNDKKEMYTTNLFYMDTYINVKIYDVDKDLKDKAFDNIDKIYKRYHELSDRYNQYENIKNIYYINNTLAINTELTIDKELYDLIDYSLSFCKDSNGLLNIAMGNVIDVWKSYRDGVKEGIPSIDELKDNNVNLNDLVLLDNNKILKKSNISLDLGAFAKGYATEMVGRYLESINIDKYIINAGGNVKVGKHYDNKTYKIGLQKPTKDSEIYKVVNGNNIAVTTSGSYERFYEYNGEIYHHIIDPTTLFPPKYMLSVSVITNDSRYADALDTMLFLMPIDEGLVYVNKLDNVEAIWFTNDSKVIKSEGFNKYE